MKIMKILVVCSILTLLFILACSKSTEPEVGFTIGGIGPAGGHIFYDKGKSSDGWRYMEVAPAHSEFNADWGTWVGNPNDFHSIVWHDVPGTQTDIGTGRKNTELIIAKLNELDQTGRAAQRCTALIINGFSDWFLPSRDELNLMYANLHRQSIGGFSGDWYWSSSQVNTIDPWSVSAWGQHFAAGNQYSTGRQKDSQLRVRAVRVF
jgi:hypothetical protein